jgi:hypothetical protein
VNADTLIITLISALTSGIGVALFNLVKDNKKEIARKKEREQDLLKIDLKDLQIKLYKVEKDLNEWKEKYYKAIQELIEVKAELEQTLIKLTHIEIHED